MGIICQRVAKIFGDPPVRALSDISLEIKDGEFLSLTGKSGSGKSTLLYILSTLDKPTNGHVQIDHKELEQLSPKELFAFRNQQMGFIFQFHYLIAELSTLENVLLPTRKSKSEEKLHDYAIELLNKFELDQKLKRLPSQLSGGEQQRVAIARALMMRPKYLFADEPTGSLDSANSKSVMNILKEVNQHLKTTIVLVTHDPDYAAMAERQIYLKDGMIVDRLI